MLTLQEHVVDGILNPTFAQFQRTVSASKGCCSLKSLDWSQGTPNYSDPFVQQLYVLKYYWAYLCEYRTLYATLLPLLDGEPPNVISIGAGSEVDLAGLYFASGQSEHINYHGYDVVDWQIKPNLPTAARKFTHGCASGLACTSPSPSNVILFPKSLGDITQPAFEAIKNAFQTTSFTARRLVLASVHPASDNPARYRTDVARFRELVEIMGAKTRRKVLDNSHPHSPFQNVGYWWALYPISLPKPLLTYVTNIYAECPTRLSKGKSCKADCPTILGRSPTLNNDNVRFQYVGFEQ